MKRRWEVEVWWRVGSSRTTVKAWTFKGAIRAGREHAKRLKPRADVIGVSVLS